MVLVEILCYDAYPEMQKQVVRVTVILMDIFKHFPKWFPAGYCFTPKHTTVWMLNA